MKIISKIAILLVATTTITQAADITQTVNSQSWLNAVWGSPAATPTIADDYIADEATLRTTIAGSTVSTDSADFTGQSLTVNSGTKLLVKQSGGNTASINSGEGDLNLDGGLITHGPNSSGTATINLNSLNITGTGSRINLSTSGTGLTFSGTLTGTGDLSINMESGTTNTRYVSFDAISAYSGAINLEDGIKLAFGSDYTFTNKLEIFTTSKLDVTHHLTFIYGDLVDGDNGVINVGTYSGSLLIDLGPNYIDNGGSITILPRPGVYAHYSFDSDFTDSSGYNLNGTLTDVGTIGNTRITSSAGGFKFGGGALDFADEQDYVSIPSINFAAEDAYSISFWAQVDDATRQWNMAMGQVGNTNHFIAPRGDDNTLRWRGASNADTQQADFSTDVNDTNWHHYTIVADGNGSTSCYLDGSLVSTDTGNTTGFIMDAIGAAYSSGGLDFRGRIDEVWIFNIAIDAATITNLYTDNTPASPAQLLHHRYDVDVSDSSPANNDGTATTGASISADASDIAAGAGALLLAGSSSQVSLSTPIDLADNTPWSVAWWARVDTLGNKGMIAGNTTNTQSFIWMRDGDTGLRFRSTDATDHDFTIALDNDIHHYALVADGTGNLSLYLNGSLLETKSGNTSFNINAIGNGYTGDTYRFGGALDEIRVFNGTLSATEVSQIYNQEKPAPVPPPVFPSVTKVRIMFVGGQSNADGRANVSDLPTTPVNLQEPQDDVDFIYKVNPAGTVTHTTLRPGLAEYGGFGPSITLGRTLADHYAGEANTRVAIVKYANGGTRLYDHWKAGGDATTTGDGPDYVAFQQTVTEGFSKLAAKYPNASLEIQGMLWVQGESDAESATYAAVYQSRLEDFIADIRLTYAANAPYGASLPFFISRLSDVSPYTYEDTVQAAQDAIAAADNLVDLFNTDTGFGFKGDNIHYNAAGQQKIGAVTAPLFTYYTWVLDTFTQAEIDAGNAEKNADPDGDGETNEEEYMGNSAPKDATSRFKATITIESDILAKIHYQSSIYRKYAVEKYNVGSEIWDETLPNEIGDGNINNRNLSLNSENAIFRIRATNR